jgi:uncharacterized membrane protein required for colicin V production
MVLAELAGLVAGVVAAVAAYKVSKIGQVFMGARYYTEKSTQFQQALVVFEFDKIFTLRLNSKGSAQFVQVGLVAICFAIAFLIVCVGLRTLGFGA